MLQYNPQCGVWLTLSRISFLISLSLEVIFIWHSKELEQKWHESLNLSLDRSLVYNLQFTIYICCGHEDEGVERVVTELEILQVDWSTSVCVLETEMLINLLLMIRKPLNHLIQKTRKLWPVGSQVLVGFVHGNLWKGLIKFICDQNTGQGLH